MSWRNESTFKKLGMIVVALTCIGCESPIDNGSTDVPDVNSAHQTSEAVKPELPAEHIPGHQVYVEECSLCHDHGEAGAPRLGNPLQWDKRVGQGEQVLVEHAIHGFEGMWGDMPPQGKDLSDKQVEAAVKYMLYRYELAKQKE